MVLDVHKACSGLAKVWCHSLLILVLDMFVICNNRSGGSSRAITGTTGPRTRVHMSVNGQGSRRLSVGPGTVPAEVQR